MIKKTKDFINSETYTTKDGVKISYITNTNKINKKKPLLVFNYGLVCNKYHWEHQFNFFHQNGYQVLAHDYRCHYDSTCKKGISELTFNNIADDINELLTHLGATKIIMLGHSMGVNITLEFVRRHSRKIKAIILISGTIRSPQDVMFDTNIVRLLFPYVERLYEKSPRIFRTIWKTSFLNPLIVNIIRDGGFNKENIPPEIVVHYLKNIGLLSPQIFFQLFKEMNYHEIGPYLGRIKKPTLIIGGNNDKVIPPHLQHKLHAEIKNSEISIIKNGSHMVQMDFPNIVNQKIQKFLNKLDLLP